MTTTVLGLFPPGSRVDADGELVVGGCRLADLAAEWGTPLYVVDEAAVRAQVRRFRRALDAAWPGARMVFASKAFPSTAMYRLMAEEGIGVDVAGPGELAMALAGGLTRPGSSCTATPRPRPNSSARSRPASG